MAEKENKHELALKAIEGFRHAAIEVVNLFAEKHELPRYNDRDTYFVDKYYNTCMFGDYAFGMQTMIDSLLNDLPSEELLRWYDYLCDYGQVFGSVVGSPNFKSWCQGCPRIDLAPLMEKKKELETMISEAKKGNMF